jgi:CubicO group peptidase (beta-lactamase class C family)
MRIFSMKSSRRVLLIACAGMALTSGFPIESIANGRIDSTRLESGHFAARLEVAREAAGLPAIAAAIITSTNVNTAVVGVRQLGAPDRAQIDDLWHLGSCTKSMTATMIATLVEQGLLRWDSRIDEVLPDVAINMREEYRTVTLEQLLRHRAGMPSLLFLDEILALPSFDGSATAQRLGFAAYALSQPPAAPVGQYAYANGGYAIAAAMAERVTHRRYERLMRETLFRPLKATVTFGWPTQRDPSQPWGHLVDDAGALVPIDLTEPQYAFPAFLSPAGNTSLTIADFARYVQLHLRGMRGEGSILQFETFRRLHSPTVTPGQRVNYASGWEEFRLRGERTSFHDGEAGAFYAIMYIQPRRNRAVVVVTNGSSQQAFTTLDALARDLLLGTRRR